LSAQPDVWPAELRFERSARNLHVAFEDGAKFDIPYELLRVESPSAEVQGHGPTQKQIVLGKKDIDVVDAEPVGRYAVRITFDDGHNTGLFTWAYLRKLGLEQDYLLAAYRAASKKF
jgi:DUF971 family protein